MENNSDICGIVSSIVLDCFLVHHKNKNFGAYTQIMDTIPNINANRRRLPFDFESMDSPWEKEVLAFAQESPKSFF